MALTALAGSALRGSFCPVGDRNPVKGLESNGVGNRGPSLSGEPTTDDMPSGVYRAPDVGGRQTARRHLVGQPDGAQGEGRASNGVRVHARAVCSQLGPSSSDFVPGGTCLREALPFGNNPGMPISDRFRAAREHAGLSQGALADRCAALGHSVSRGQIAKLEVGERLNPRASDAAAIARATGVRLAWLLDGSGTMTAEDAPDGDSSALEGAIAWFLAHETHEGRGDEARAFLAARRETFAGAEGLSPRCVARPHSRRVPRVARAFEGRGRARDRRRRGRSCAEAQRAKS